MKIQPTPPVVLINKRNGNAVRNKVKQEKKKDGKFEQSVYTRQCNERPRTKVHPTKYGSVYNRHGTKRI